MVVVGTVCVGDTVITKLSVTNGVEGETVDSSSHVGQYNLQAVGGGGGRGVETQLLVHSAG